MLFDKIGIDDVMMSDSVKIDLKAEKKLCSWILLTTNQNIAKLSPSSSFCWAEMAIFQANPATHPSTHPPTHPGEYFPGLE